MRPITASDLMNPNLLSVREDMSLQKLATFLMENEITGAPVRNRAGQLVGVVSLVDLARATSGNEDGEDEDTSAGKAKAVAEEPLDDDPLDEELTVADLMTPAIFTVNEDSTVSEIASTMLDNHLHRVVVTRDDEPVGIISTSDLLGLLIDEDED